MSNWSRLLLGGNLLGLTVLVSLMALQMWQSRGEQATLEPATVSAMITAIERTLDRDLSAVRSRVGNEDRGHFSEEVLRTAIRRGIEEALADKVPQIGGNGESRASASSGELGETAPPSRPGMGALADVSMAPAAHQSPAAGAPLPSSTGSESAPAKVDATPPLLREPGANRKVQEVHFSYNKAELTPSGLRKTHAAAETIKNVHAQKIRIVGYADSVGKAPYNSALSKRRAAAVADVLMSVGIPRHQIEIVGRGETGTPEVTDDEIDEPMNRCVGIFTLK